MNDDLLIISADYDTVQELRTWIIEEFGEGVFAKTASSEVALGDDDTSLVVGKIEKVGKLFQTIRNFCSINPGTIEFTVKKEDGTEASFKIPVNASEKDKNRIFQMMEQFAKNE